MVIIFACFVVFILVCFFGNYVLAIAGVLTGNKELIEDAGNLCDKSSLPYKDMYYTPEEMGLPGRKPRPPMSDTWEKHNVDWPPWVPPGFPVEKHWPGSDGTE